ncbi:MAG: exodeoxyribonuclease VII small subunit [Saprospiraceae bacterium]|nr:exodeoxyribonuclease VII small subunit [Saprospiraceae bacterium]
MAKKMDYDSAFRELKEIVIKLQDDDINIEKLSEYIKRAQELRAYCAERLREIEETIQTSIHNQ